MSRFDIIRAWKDAAFRRSLSPAQRASLPENPAGMVELTEAEAHAVEGKAGLRFENTETHCGGNVQLL